MKKSILFSFLALSLTIDVSSQEVEKDSIMSFFDKKGEVTTDKNEARTFEILTKVNDTLWLGRRFRRNGKLFHYIHYKSKDKKIKVGQSINYNKKGQTISKAFFNNKGEKHGKVQSWFGNGNKSIEGIYLKGKREGVWKLYHYNNILAARGVFKNDSLIRATFFDTDGNKMQYTYTDFEIKKPTFSGGIENYREKLKPLVKNIDYKINGKVNVNYTIHIDGTIKDVTIDENLPKKLQQQIIKYFENIKGWSSASHLNRKIPMNYSQPLTFRN